MAHFLPSEEPTVGPPCRILLVEDAPADAALVLRELRGAGLRCETRRVETEAEVHTALAEFAPDVVLADHTLAGFGASDALRIVRAERPGTPVIIVTGSLDEETAASYILAGAVDYVVKDRLFRLPAAVRRAFALRRAEADAARTALALRQLEEQHRQAQKMEAIGRLASGVAHDFNNLLTVINSCCSFALEEAPEGAKIRQDLLDIREAADRAAQLTQQLLAFSRQRPIAPQRVDVAVLVNNLAGMLRRLLGGTVTVTFTAAPALGTVWADPGQLEQVVMNLAVNARDAMPQGGRLSLAASDMVVDAPHAAAHAVQPGPFVLLAVTDTGTGMDASTKERLFEPFFTTKEKGKGTGLGLATVYGVVQQAGGFVQVESELGKGSTFRVYLPSKA